MKTKKKEWSAYLLAAILEAYGIELDMELANVRMRVQCLAKRVRGYSRSVEFNDG